MHASNQYEIKPALYLCAEYMFSFQTYMKAEQPDKGSWTNLFS